jgi:FMN-dependent dehydrogenase
MTGKERARSRESDRARADRDPKERILTHEDAILAADNGIDGIIVSNHGGRVVDSGCGTIEVLPEIIKAVGGRMPVLVDSGFRRGTDIIKAWPWVPNLFVSGFVGPRGFRAARCRARPRDPAQGNTSRHAAGRGAVNQASHSGYRAAGLILKL